MTAPTKERIAEIRRTLERQWFGDACAACEHEDCAHVRGLATLRAALAAAKEGA